MAMQWSERQEQVKQKFISDRGTWKWNEMWDTILELDPDIVEAYATYSSVCDKRDYLSLRVRKFIYIAIDSITGSLNEKGLKGHMKHALQLGISIKEILEVLEITSMIGSVSYSFGIPSLVKEFEKHGVQLSDVELTDRQKEIRDTYKKTHNNYWTDEKEYFLKLDQECFEAFEQFENTPWKSGCLSPKEKELIYVAIHAAPVSLNRDEMEYHMGRAIDHGATKEELMEVLNLVSCLGIHAITMGVPILKEALLEVKEMENNH